MLRGANCIPKGKDAKEFWDAALDHSILSPYSAIFNGDGDGKRKRLMATGSWEIGVRNELSELLEGVGLLQGKKVNYILVVPYIYSLYISCINICT